jgi:thiol:disulfide interchange protein DsbC
MICSFSRSITANLAAAGFLILGASAYAAEQDDELEAVRETVSGMFEEISPEHIQPSPIDGWYTIQKGPVVAYISADGRYLLQGDLIDLDAGINLSEASRNGTRRDLIAAVSDDQVIKFTPADVKHSVTVFTDVECTYCRRLHSQIDEYLAHGIEVRYLLYPRNGPASRSWSTSEEVYCSSDRNKALTAAKLDEAFQTVACDTSVIQDTYALGQDVGLSGTPAIILEDGTLIGGYLPPDALNQRLNN